MQHIVLEAASGSTRLTLMVGPSWWRPANIYILSSKIPVHHLRAAGLSADPKGRPWCSRFLQLWDFSGKIKASAIVYRFSIIGNAIGLAAQSCKLSTTVPPLPQANHRRGLQVPSAPLRSAVLFMFSFRTLPQPPCLQPCRPHSTL